MAVTGFAPPLPQRNDARWLIDDKMNTILRERSTSRLSGHSSSISAPPIEGSDTIAFLSHHAELFSPLEISIFSKMDAWYAKSLAIKCPFFRRRSADFLDGVDMIVRFLMVRHKSLDLIPPPGCRGTKSTCQKFKGLGMEDIRSTLLTDWREDTQKGYYITGRLNATIYRNDCLFDGPDPDMPVQGLRKYLNAASQLFDYKTSFSELISLNIVDERTLFATWRMRGVLRLPWRPELPEWSGTTTYHVDDEGLIYLHEETWDMSVEEAFLKTLLPDVAKHVWPAEEKRVFID